jgi:RimJ/RimL family protein N-acetyltransferase
MAITTLATEKDKKGSTVQIKHTSALSYTPVLPFFMKQFSNLCDKGWAHPTFTASNTTKAVYAEIQGKVVGHIVYNLLDDQLKTAWIVLSAVDEEYRQRGIYNLMHTQFESTIKKAGSKKIASYVHIDNIPRQNSCASSGMRPFYYKMEKDL